MIFIQVMSLDDIKIGFGTWQNTLPKECVESVKNALDIGYRHIDTAQEYGNEEFVGEGISRSKIDRDNVVLATKVWIENLSYDDVLKSTRESIDKLNTDYIDILYIHWPAGEYNPQDTLKAFDKLYKDNIIKNIGLSNFTIDLIKEAEEILNSPIYANQIEMHPLLHQQEMLDYLQKKNIYLVAYSPLARGRVFDISELNKISDKHNVSEAQVSLAWLMNKENVIPIPKATSKSHIKDNYEALKLKLDSEDIRLINSIEREKRFVDIDFAPWNK